MCGICGIHWFDPDRPIDTKLLGVMTRILEHRGPDDEGIHVEPGLGLGHRRLSIIGLEDGQQPMSTEDRSIWLVCNGELYNHPEIRRELEAKGAAYRTSSDTESFLHLYRDKGLDFLESVRGMFALALWDRVHRRLILARDRVGIKPLFYYYLPGMGLRFASEIKSLLCDPEVPREIDLEALNLYLAFLGTPTPWTMLKGIRKLEPGQMLIAQGDQVTFRSFWRPWDRVKPVVVSDADAIHLVRDRVRDAVRSHLLADVPVGALLSGGIDSSILVALMTDLCGQGVPTFSIGFEGQSLFDETEDARLIARTFGTNHHEERLTAKDLLEVLPQVMWAFDEPLADSSALPTYAVSRLARREVKVVLSGDGGDEIFAGYRKYTGEYFRRYLEWVPPRALAALNAVAQAALPESRSGPTMDRLRQVKKFLRGLASDPIDRHLGWAIHFEDRLRDGIYSEDVRASLRGISPRDLFAARFQEAGSTDLLNRMLWTDFRQGLVDDMLVKVDRMSMLNSLEVRVPLLDHELAEALFALPGHLKLRGKTTKWVLKRAFAGLLPDCVLRKPKHGFDVPIGEWIKKDLREVIEDTCGKGAVSKRGLFDPQAVRRLLDDHLSGRRELNNQLWILLSLEWWQRLYLDRSSPGRPGV